MRTNASNVWLSAYNENNQPRPRSTKPPSLMSVTLSKISCCHPEDWPEILPGIAGAVCGLHPMQMDLLADAAVQVAVTATPRGLRISADDREKLALALVYHLRQVTGKETALLQFPVIAVDVTEPPTVEVELPLSS